MNNLLSIALELMLLGMGTVFVFLVVLILATKIMSSLVLRSKMGVKEEAIPAISTPISAAGNPAQDKRLIKVIEEAIKLHRNH